MILEMKTRYTKKETMNFIITQMKAQILILKETALQQLNNEIPE